MKELIREKSRCERKYKTQFNQMLFKQFMMSLYGVLLSPLKICFAMRDKLTLIEWKYMLFKLLSKLRRAAVKHCF